MKWAHLVVALRRSLDNDVAALWLAERLRRLSIRLRRCGENKFEVLRLQGMAAIEQAGGSPEAGHWDVQIGYCDPGGLSLGLRLPTGESNGPEDGWWVV
jgi:hypothetical protein